MYSIASLSNESREFIGAIPKISNGNRGIVSFGLAKVIANSLTLPSSPVELASDYYNQNACFKVSDTLNFINELTVIDIERIEELTKSFWLIRYNVLFAKRKLFKLNSVAPALTFFGVTNRVSVTDYEFISTNEVSIINIHNGFFQIIAELEKDDTQNNDGSDTVLTLRG